MDATILIVEPNEQAASLIEQAVTTDGCRTSRAEGYDTAVLAISRENPDLVLSEMFLGRRSGVDLCRWLKRATSTHGIPFVFVSAAVRETERIAGLEAGATDYITKPFNVTELHYRVRAILGRTNTPRRSLFVATDSSRHSRGKTVLTLNGRDITLFQYEYRLLMALLDSGGKVMTRRDIIDAVWGPGSVVSERTVDAHVKGLRQKLGHDRGLLETVCRVGYRIAEDMRGTDLSKK